MFLGYLTIFQYDEHWAGSLPPSFPSLMEGILKVLLGKTIVVIETMKPNFNLKNPNANIFKGTGFNLVRRGCQDEDIIGSLKYVFNVVDSVGQIPMFWRSPKMRRKWS